MPQASSRSRASVQVDDAGAGAADEPGSRSGGAPSPTSSSVAGLAPADTRSWLGVAALTLLLATPLLVAAAALARPRWFPILDLAMTELRIRDVGTRNTPLIGLPGRIGVLGGEQGSHPGPLSFWLLAPTYRLFGATAWASEVATVVLHTVAIGTSLWVARRRGGWILLLGVAAVLATLARTYGPEVLTQPWNPYMPLLAWFLVLLAVWSVLCRDIVLLPVAVVAGSLCAQTHAPYLGLVGGMGLLALLGAADAFRRTGKGSDDRRRVVRWTLASVALGGLLWLAPVIDQLTVDPGNISLLADHFGSPPEEPVGLRRGFDMVLLHLDPWRLVTEQGADTGSLSEAAQAPTGSRIPGLLLLVAWGAAVVVAWRLRHQALLRLHVVCAVGLVLAVFSISRVFGPLWYYLMLWAWSITSLMILAAGWTLAASVARRSTATQPSLRRAGVAALAAAAVVSTAVFAVDATQAEQPAEDLSQTMAVMMPDVLDALDDEDLEGRGHDERYLVQWSDAIHIGAQGIALVNELDRAGFDVGVVEAWSVPVGRHRSREPEESTSFIRLATGVHVERWRASPDATEIAFVDLRTSEQLAEFERTRADVIGVLEEAGLPDLVTQVDFNLFAAAIDPRLPQAAEDGMTRLLELGQPTAIFVGGAGLAALD